MTLATVWFLLIAVLWVGYFVLEGFDFGVGMLVGLLGKKDDDRRVMINTIGPVWDGNEVWLLTAGGATFAAFPEWYATLFSGLYLPLFLILLALIIRGVAFEYRHKRNSAQWKRAWDWCIIVGSAIPALVWGVGFANFVSGLPIVKAPAGWVMETSVGNFFGLFMPFALLGGVLTLSLFLFHGAVFITLKTKGEITERARGFAKLVGLVAVAATAAFTLWQAVAYGKGVLSWILALLAIAGVSTAWVFNNKARSGLAFLGNVVAILFVFSGIFVSMFPNAITSNLDPVAANTMSLQAAASTPYTLTIMTIAAAVFVPIVLAYQAWTFWVFRKRISAKNLPAETSEVAAITQPTTG